MATPILASWYAGQVATLTHGSLICLCDTKMRCDFSRQNIAVAAEQFGFLNGRVAVGYNRLCQGNFLVDDGTLVFTHPLKDLL